MFCQFLSLSASHSDLMPLLFYLRAKKGRAGYNDYKEGQWYVHLPRGICHFLKISENCNSFSGCIF